MQQTVVGFFDNGADAERAAEQLRSSGFEDRNIDISTSHTGSYTSSENVFNQQGREEETSPYNVSDESRYETTGDQTRVSSDTLNEDRLRERRGDDDNEGFGDSIGRFFRNLFDNKEEAERYTSVGRRNSIVSVFAETATEAERARDILDECGAVDVDEQVQQYGAYGSYADSLESDADDRNIVAESEFDIDERSADANKFDLRNTTNPDGLSEKSIPVIEENINIDKRSVETGGVRLRSRIVERPVEESVRLRKEHVRVDRVGVDRPATDADFETFREGEVELTETSEVPLVKKEARVIEEVRLSKEVEEREESISDTVRKTDVEIENLGEDKLKNRRTRKKL